METSKRISLVMLTDCVKTSFGNSRREELYYACGISSSLKLYIQK